MQGVSVRRNPPHGKGTPHIRRITPRPNKSGKSKPNQVARLIRPTGGGFLYAVRGIAPYGLRLIGLRESALQLYSMGRADLPTGHKRASKPPMLNSVKFPGIPPNKIQMFGNVGIEISMVGFVCGGLPRGESALQL